MLEPVQIMMSSAMPTTARIGAAEAILAMNSTDRSNLSITQWMVLYQLLKSVGEL